MKYSILGFNQEKLMSTDLDIKDIHILKYIQDACGSTNMYHKLDSDGKPYVWINHDKFNRDLPFLRISTSTLANRLSELKQAGYINSIIVTSESGRGTRTYYGITEITMDLMFSTDDETTTSQKWEMKTTTTSQKNEMVARPLPKNGKSDNILDTDIELNKDKSKSTTDITEKFLKDYTEICQSLPKVRMLSDKRKDKIRKLCKKYNYDDILEVLHKAEESDFMKGKNDRGWKADIDFILRDDKFVSIFEGKYDNKKGYNAQRKEQVFCEVGVTSEKVTKEEIENGYFSGEIF